MKIGVLALQGAVSEHLEMLRRCGCKGIPVKESSELSEIKGLILPGGESTTVGKLMERFDFLKKLKALGEKGFPIYGTCTGLILLGKNIKNGEKDQPTLELIDIDVKRNGFGRQSESFEAPVKVSEFGSEPFPGVFIRAPFIEKVGEGVKVLAKFEDKIVAVRKDNILATAFHPELTDDERFHQYFIDMIRRD